MVEELIQLMVARWGLPEVHVRKFMNDLFPAANSSEIKLEDVREKTSDLLQSLVLQNID